MNTIYQLLNPSNTMSVNRLLAHALGLNEALIYSVLISKHYYYSERDMLNEGWFYSTTPDLQESTTIPEKQQKKAIDNLVKAGLIKCELRGMPAKRSFFIVEDVELINRLVAEGEERAAKIKPAAAESYERKRPSSDKPTEEHKQFVDFLEQAFGNPHNNAVSPCSAEMAEQAPPKRLSLLRQNGGASSDETAEHTYQSKYNKSKYNQSINPALARDAGIADESAKIDRIDMTENAPEGFSSDLKEKICEREFYLEKIHENIDYAFLCENQNNPKLKINLGKVDELVEIMLDVVCSNKPTIRVNGEELPQEVAKSRFLKLNSEHIEYVMTALARASPNIKDIRAYLITTLYNAPTTIENFYSAWVNYDRKTYG